jgi:hypothetical protein
MPFHIFRFFINILIESYVLSVLLFWGVKNYFPPFLNRQASMIRIFTLIGLVLSILALGDEGNDYLLVPTNNYQIHWRAAPYWHLFRQIAIGVFLLSIGSFIYAKRSQRVSWMVIGMVLLWLPSFAHAIESWLTINYDEVLLPLRYHPLSFSGMTWWICWLLVAVILGIAFFGGRKA